MSASNWTVCPRCTKLRGPALEALRTELAAAYGQVPIAEFNELRARLTREENAIPASTLREDYEFYGAEDGTVIAEYACSCTKCGLESDFTHRHELNV